MVTGPLVVELTLVKCHRKLVVYLSSAWKKGDIFKIHSDDDDDDDDDDTESMPRLYMGVTVQYQHPL